MQQCSPAVDNFYTGSDTWCLASRRAREHDEAHVHGKSFPVRAEFEGYSIELRSVDPYPMTTALPNVQDYEATLFVDVAAP